MLYFSPSWRTLPLPIHVMLDTGCVSTHSKRASSLSFALTSSIFTTNSTLDTLRTQTEINVNNQREKETTTMQTFITVTLASVL